MKFYYDMLIPFMPEQTLNSETQEMQDDSKLIGIKAALINLSNYQTSTDRAPIHLYHAIVNICKGLNLELQSTVIDAINHTELLCSDTSSIADAIALKLFSITNTESSEFDPLEVIGYLLGLAHLRFSELNKSKAEVQDVMIPNNVAEAE